jgi:hypothetical protein
MRKKLLSYIHDQCKLKIHENELSIHVTQKVHKVRYTVQENWCTTKTPNIRNVQLETPKLFWAICSLNILN